MGVGPVPMEFNDIGMIQLREVLKHHLDLLLLVLEVLSLGELDLVPYYLHALFHVHCQEGAVDARHVTLLNLFDKPKKKLYMLN